MWGPILAATGRAIVGISQNRSQTRHKRDLIRDAYNRGHERLNLSQQDVRQGEGESLIARGLAGGGGISDRGAVAPGADRSVGGAHTLGEQQLTDLHREQTLEQDNLVNQRDNAFSDVDAESTQNTINTISSAIQAGGSLASAMPGAGGAAAPSAAAASVGGGEPAAGALSGGAPAASSVGTIRGAYGLDVLNPQMPTRDLSMGTGQANYNFRKVG